MKLQLLISTMNSSPFSLMRKMNVRSSAVIVNQGDSCSEESIIFNDRDISWFNFRERGIGISRNEALMRAKCDVVLFCDEDCTYFADTEKTILEEFLRHPDADVILFDLVPVGHSDARNTLRITATKRVGKLSFMKYGAVHIAARLPELRKHGILFSQMFGGGAKYSCGEDSIFLKDCLDSGLKVITSPKTIGKVDFSSSSWFEGYSEKYFRDKGALHCCLFRNLHRVVSLRFAYKNVLRAEGYRKFFESVRLMNEGAKSFAARQCPESCSGNG